MNRKKIALIALLITVIAAAALFAVKRVQSELKGPPLLQDQKFDKIDMKSLKFLRRRSATGRPNIRPTRSVATRTPRPVNIRWWTR